MHNYDMIFNYMIFNYDIIFIQWKQTRWVILFDIPNEKYEVVTYKQHYNLINVFCSFPHHYYVAYTSTGKCGCRLIFWVKMF